MSLSNPPDRIPRAKALRHDGCFPRAAELLEMEKQGNMLTKRRLTAPAPPETTLAAGCADPSQQRRPFPAAALPDAKAYAFSSRRSFLASSLHAW